MQAEPKRYRKSMAVAGGGVALLAAGGLWLWIDRTPIARGYIDDILARKGVTASYRITRFGLRSQRIEQLVVGDPRHPDLTADRVDVGLSLGIGGVGLRAIDVSGVRLHGRLVDGRLSLGAIDRLLPKSSAGGPALPDIDLTAHDARILLDTPQGTVRAEIDGAGGLAGGFRGTVKLASEALAIGGCRIATPRGVLKVSVEAGRPSLAGPVAASVIDCAGQKLRIGAPLVDLEARGEPDLARWLGTAVVQRGVLSSPSATAANLGGRIGFDASAAQISGGGSIFADAVRTVAARAGRIAFEGDYKIDPVRTTTVVGEVRFTKASLSPDIADRWLGDRMTLIGTPIARIAGSWRDALRAAGRSIDGQLALSVESGPAGGVVRVERLDAQSASGVRLLIRGERAEGLAWQWPRRSPAINASAELGGGGLPETRISLQQPGPGAPLSGFARIAPTRIGDARLALDPIQFGAAPGGGTFVRTKVTVDGPLADGRVEGLALPVTVDFDRSGAIAVNRACAPLSFDRLVIAGTAVAKATLPLCPVGGALVGLSAGGRLFGGAAIAKPRLAGRLGDQPLTMTAGSLAVTMAVPGFTLADLAVRLGSGLSPTRLDVAQLQGGIDAAGIGGRFTGAAGNIGAVPLLLSKGDGTWRLASSILTLGAALAVADAEKATPRFLPLLADTVVLTLKDRHIGVTGVLKEPTSGTPVSRVTIRHDLATGRGDAALDVSDLRFTKAFQPERITPLTKGIIANVAGGVSGQGRIAWTGDKVTSDGEFRTDGIDLAAAFGQVSGIKGTIRFTDLLGLVSAPDQQVTLTEINPGISVTNGVVRYQLLPDRLVAVKSGDWPFSGGTLVLEPTTLDLGQAVARRLTFRLTALDAGTFLQQLEFKNIAVTGKFDGVLPIVFDADGGRIEKGLLTVRPGGGTLAYVGDVTNADLGRFARLAFDALKSLHYDRLTIELNGALDGEIVSKVRFDGKKDPTVVAKTGGGLAARVIAPLTRLPFRFNITITAPFRGLVGSAQTFADPSLLLRSAPPAEPAPPVPIQPR